MPGRPRTPVGHYGEISCTQGPSGTWEARTRYRAHDRKLHPIKRSGPTETKAKARLKEAITEELAKVRSQRFSSDTQVAEIATAYFLEADRLAAQGSMSPTTVEQYRGCYGRTMEDDLGSMAAWELDVPTAHDFLADLAAGSPSSAKMAKSVLSGICRFGTARGAWPANPIRETGRIETPDIKAPTAMSAAQIVRWLAVIDGHARAQQWSLGDVTRFMCATGVRIAEALAISWDGVDLDAGTVAVDHRIIRLKGQGVFRARNTKRASGDRILKLPAWGVSMLRKRQLAAPPGAVAVFGGLSGGWLDPWHTRRVLRELRTEAGFPDLTSHRFRKAVATILHKGGAKAAAITAQLGHSKVTTTMDLYIDRDAVNDGNESILDRDLAL